MDIIKWNRFEDDWLDIGDTSQLTDIWDGPFYNSQRDNRLAPGISELAVMSNIDYMYYAVKFFCGVSLLPFQAAMLDEITRRSFPLLLMSRGGGKTYMLAIHALMKALFNPEHKVVIAGAGFRQSKQVFENIERIWNSSPMLKSVLTKSSGPRHDNDRWTFHVNNSTIVAVPVGCLAGDTLITTDRGITTIKDAWVDGTDNCRVWDGYKFTPIGFHHYNGIKPTIRVTTLGGYQYISTPDHKMQIVIDNKIIWKETKDLSVNDRILIDISNRWPSTHTFDCTEDQAYCLGLMIGDGNYTNKYFMRFTTKDEFFLQYLDKEIGKFKDQHDGLHYQLCSKNKRKEWMNFWGLSDDNRYTLTKLLPSTILSSSKSCMRACLQGLFDTDGTVSVINNNGGQSVLIGYTGISKRLVEQIQYTLTHFGIYSSILVRSRENSTSPLYDLSIRGVFCKKFAEEIGFRLPRKKDLLSLGIKNQKRFYTNKHNIPIDKNILLELIKDYPLGHRFGEKDILSRKVITRNYLNLFISRFIKRYGNLDVLNILHDLNKDYHYDYIVNVEPYLAIPTYDINVPEHHTYIANGFVSHNTGDKIRGLRANTIVADEFASHNPDIYETVIAGFASVESQPAEGVQKTRMREIMIEEGLWDEDSEDAFQSKTENQSIITGTASYSFNHFYDYYKRYKSIIESKGDEQKLLEVLNGKIPDGFNWKDYSIIRIPFSHMPKGFMSEKNVGRAQATVHSSIYMMEYECCFCDDSDGFYKRTLIESCVAREKNMAKSDWPDWCPYPFSAVTRGDPNKKYVYGIDPAFEVDNFSISVLELNDNHSRLVYAWTINKEKFLEAVKLGITTENDYYQFCARKIRDLMKVFPAMAIGIDAQGGGGTIEQALHDSAKLQSGEVPLWSIVEDNKKKETDHMPGLHILHMIQFASPSWTSDANYGMLQDFQGKMLLFPEFDQVSLEIAAGQDLMREKEFKEKFNKKLTIFDSLEDCVMEIEETKEELSTIRVTRTGTGVNSRERWSTPETKLSGDRKGYLRKDRYSSLLIANYLARLFRNKLPEAKYQAHGGFVSSFKPKSTLMYSGPAWVTEKTNK